MIKLSKDIPTNDGQPTGTSDKSTLGAFSFREPACYTVLTPDKLRDLLANLGNAYARQNTTRDGCGWATAVGMAAVQLLYPEEALSFRKVCCQIWSTSGTTEARQSAEALVQLANDLYDQVQPDPALRESARYCVHQDLICHSAICISRGELTPANSEAWSLENYPQDCLVVRKYLEAVFYKLDTGALDPKNLKELRNYWNHIIGAIQIPGHNEIIFFDFTPKQFEENCSLISCKASNEAFSKMEGHHAILMASPIFYDDSRRFTQLLYNSGYSHLSFQPYSEYLQHSGFSPDTVWKSAARVIQPR